MSRHPFDEFFGFRGAASRTCHQIDGDLGRCCDRETGSVGKGASEDDVALRLGQHHVRAGISRAKFPESRGVLSVRRVDHGGAGWSIGSPVGCGQGPGHGVPGGVVDRPPYEVGQASRCYPPCDAAASYESVVLAPTPQQRNPVGNYDCTRARPTCQVLTLQKLDHPVGRPSGHLSDVDQLTDRPRSLVVQQRTYDLRCGSALQRSARSPRTAPRVMVGPSVRDVETGPGDIQGDVPCRVYVGQAGRRQPFAHGRRQVAGDDNRMAAGMLIHRRVQLLAQRGRVASLHHALDFHHQHDRGSIRCCHLPQSAEADIGSS
ncbi:hypothetical protein Nocox_02950 [Nonomuraea coxensis DSM 45129]|uniref:Uncharacterized protein n=1 Tax=Nonomuraea coxensis DSM 45129 TaxID=1122611 RepID=A0ABX8TRW8_9ACTN|nr:hypothetical protein Nocox_02950 [Nonomuraea coxensis DSM 45129]